MPHTALRPLATIRKVLALDAASCLAMGLAMCVASGALSRVFALPEPLVWWAGALLFPCAALMLLAAWPRATPVALAWLVVVGNAAWAVASVLVVAVFAPSAIGTLFVLGQAAAVAVFAFLEYRSLPGGRAQRLARTAHARATSAMEPSD